MYINKFSVRIIGGKEDHSGYVKIKHKQQYKIALKNDWDEPCNAVVKVDGREIGSFRISAKSSIVLERPVNDDGCFTFFRSASAEGEASGVSSIAVSDRGLIEVTFTPGKSRPIKTEHHHHHHYWHSRWWVNPYYEEWDYYPRPYKVTWSVTGGTSANIAGDVQAHCYNMSLDNTSEVAEGITGLSGYSDQQYCDAEAIDLDYSRQTVITLRLVEDVNGTAIDARPVVSQGNPIPPPVS